MNDDDDFGGFEEAQPIDNSSIFVSSNEPLNSIIDKNSSKLFTNEQKAPDWLVESFQKTINIQTNQNKLKSNEESIIPARPPDSLYEYNKSQIQKPQITDADVKILLDQQEKLFNSQIERLEKLIIRNNSNLEDKFEHKLAVIQEQIMKHHQSTYSDLETKLNKSLRAYIDEQLIAKVQHTVDLIVKEQKNENEKFLKQYFQSQSEVFMNQIKSNIEQETLILKDIFNSKIDKLIKKYEIKAKNTNGLYIRQLQIMNQFLDNTKTQLNLMQSHLKKQNEYESKLDIDPEFDEPDETLLNM